MFASHQNLRELACTQDVCIVSEANIEEVTQTALEYLSKSPKVVLVDKFLQDVMVAHKTNNNNTVSPLKHIILNYNYKLFYLPMVSFIYNPKL